MESETTTSSSSSSAASSFLSTLADLSSSSGGNNALEENLGASTVAMMILFGAATFATVGMAAKTWLLEDYRAIQAATDLTKQHQLQPYRTISALDLSFTSLYTFLYHASLLGLILFAVYILERHPPFPHDDKTAFDSDFMVFVLLLILLVAWNTVERNDGKKKQRQKQGTAAASSSTGGLASAMTSGGSVADRKKMGVTFHADATVTSVAASRTSRGASVASSKSGAGSAASATSAASSTGSAEIMDLQQDDGDYDLNNGAHQQSILRRRGSGGGGGGDGGGASSMKSEEHKSMLAAHGLHVPQPSQSPHVASVLEMVGAGPGHSNQSISSAGHSAGASVYSMDKKLEDILLDDETVMTEGSLSKKEAKVFGDSSANRRLAPAEPVNDLLNNAQSLEWKGWMSTAFLVYEISNAGSYVPYVDKQEEQLDEDLSSSISSGGAGINTYYNLARVVVSCYIFITGFNHTIYFYAKQDYSIVRVLRMLFRINLTVIFLCLMLGSRYILYNICPLHSYFFLLVYGTMCLHRGINYTKFGLRMKIVGLGLFIYLVWDCNLGLFRLLHGLFFARGPPGLSGAPYGPLWEWYYRTHLHHWSALMGMCFAVNHSILSLLLRKLEALSSSSQAISKGVTAIALLVAVSIWAMGPLDATKYTYNTTNTYFAFIPILCYLYLRNINPSMRENGLGLFKRIGRYSLEIYLLHHHLFLSNDGASVLVLLPGFPKCNAMLLGLILLNVAKLLKTVTDILTAMLLPSNDEAKSVMNVVLLGAAILIAHGVALILRALGMLNLNTIATAIVIFGVFAYQAIIDLTWNSYRRGQGKGPKLRLTETMTAKASPLIIGTLVIFLCGIAMNVASLTGATAGFVPLDAECDSLANRGVWVDVDACSPLVRGIFAREYGTGGFYETMGTCSEEDVQQWAWRKGPDSSTCHFHHRTKHELRKKLKGQKIAFIGDTMVRAMFHSVCRALGEQNCGAFDAIAPAHSDDKMTVGDTVLEYRWAPLAVEEEKKLKEYRIDSAAKGKPDLILVGGGAWDRLHVYATDEDQESHKQAVKKLASELNEWRSESIPAVWLTPTTVNTQALNNEEKRVQMSEEGMQEMRKIYADLGVESAAAFVLDGPSFTHGRAGESYDGIHYPHDVYDAGTQILANAMDWLIEDKEIDASSDGYEPPRTGSMGNPFLGMMVLCFVLIGLFFFDGYVGFSYLSSAFVRVDNPYSLMPHELYDEAFKPLHQRFKLPEVGRVEKVRVHDVDDLVAAEEGEEKSLLDTATSKEPGGSTLSRRSSSSGIAIEMT